jgi:hypothetical protein
MDSLNNYSNLSDIIGNEERNKLTDVKEETQQKLDKAKATFQEEVKSPLEMVGGGVTGEEGVKILKSVITKGKKLGDDAIKKIAKRSGMEEEDLKSFGSRFIDAYKSKGKKGLMDEISKAKGELKSKIEGKVGELKGKVKTVLDDTLKEGKTKLKRVKGITEKEINKPLEDEAVESDLLRTDAPISRAEQIAKDFDQQTSDLQVQGTRDAQRLGQEAADEIPGAPPGAPPEGQPSTLEEAKQAANDAKDAQDIKDAKDAQDAKDAAQAGKDAETGGKEAEGLVEKAGECAVEIDAEGGGPEDLAGDVVAGVTAVATLIGGIFAKKKPPPIVSTPIIQSQASFQIGA